MKKNIAKRIKQIQTWIGFDDAYTANWINLATQFAKWFTYNYNSKKIDSEVFYSKYPTLWTRYLREKNLSDKFEMNPHEDDEIVTKDKKLNPQNFNKLVMPDDYIKDEEDEIDDENATNDYEEKTNNNNDDKKIEIEKKNRSKCNVYE